MNIQFRDLKNNKMIWKQDGIEERSDFRAWGNVAETISQERTGATAQATTEIGAPDRQSGPRSVLRSGRALPDRR